MIHYSRVPKPFLSEGHISYYTTVRGSEILRNLIVSGCVKFYQINECFVQILFFIIVKMSSRVGWSGVAGRI